MSASLPVHLCGSVPLPSSRAVFEAAADTLGPRLRRYPDGETGDRLDWLQWQGQFLKRSPDLEEIVSESPYRGKQIQYRPRPGVALGDVRIGPLGYADVAIASYASFTGLKRAGRIPSPARFLVSLPTPLACTRVHIPAALVPAIDPIYEAAMLREITAMAAAISASELAVQWDVAVEFSILENPARSPISNPFAEIVDRLQRITNAIPDGIEAGIHLCYGDSGHKHFKEPEDMSRLVAVAGAVSAGMRRPLDWIHMPVPRNRADDTYFAPLGSLKLQPETELYLGLVHKTDGLEGARKRIAAARKVSPNFGIATECGFGRRPPRDVADLLRLHRDISDDRSIRGGEIS
jgi:methionine synthase II (cobalamin-independent)